MNPVQLHCGSSIEQIHPEPSERLVSTVYGLSRPPRERPNPLRPPCISELGTDVPSPATVWLRPEVSLLSSWPLSGLVMVTQWRENGVMARRNGPKVNLLPSLWVFLTYCWYHLMQVIKAKPSTDASRPS